MTNPREIIERVNLGKVNMRRSVIWRGGVWSKMRFFGCEDSFMDFSTRSGAWMYHKSAQLQREWIHECEFETLHFHSSPLFSRLLDRKWVSSLLKYRLSPTSFSGSSFSWDITQTRRVVYIPFLYTFSFFLKTSPFRPSSFSIFFFVSYTTDSSCLVVYTYKVPKTACQLLPSTKL